MKAEAIKSRRETARAFLSFIVDLRLLLSRSRSEMCSCLIVWYHQKKVFLGKKGNRSLFYCNYFNKSRHNYTPFLLIYITGWILRKHWGIWWEGVPTYLGTCIYRWNSWRLEWVLTSHTQIKSRSTRTVSRGSWSPLDKRTKSIVYLTFSSSFY